MSKPLTLEAKKKKLDLKDRDCTFCDESLKKNVTFFDTDKKNRHSQTTDNEILIKCNKCGNMYKLDVERKVNDHNPKPVE